MSRYHLKVKPQYPLRTELLNLGKESNCDQVFSFFLFFFSGPKHGQVLTSVHLHVVQVKTQSHRNRCPINYTKI